MLLNRERTHRLMREEGLDGVIATSPGNVRYFSDAEFVSMRSHPNVQFFAVLPVDAQAPSLILPNHEVDAWAERPEGITDVAVYGKVFRRVADVALDEEDERIRRLTIDGPLFESGIEALAATVHGMGLERSIIGVDESHMSGSTWSAMVEALPDADLRPCAGLLQQVRMIKTEEEVRRLKQSAESTALGMQAVFSALTAGVTEADLASVFMAEVSRQGAIPEFWLISGGRRTSHTHTRQTDYALRDGDLLKIDAGCTFDFYWSDLARTKALGKVDAAVELRYASLCEAVQAGIACMRPGVRASEVFDAAVGHVRSAGVPDYDRHHAGHGIGIEVYDPPMIKGAGRSNFFGIADVDPVLEVGMVLNVETPYYELGSFGMIVEDTVVIRESGAEILAPMSYSLNPLE